MDKLLQATEMIPGLIHVSSAAGARVVVIIYIPIARAQVAMRVLLVPSHAHASIIAPFNINNNIVIIIVPKFAPYTLSIIINISIVLIFNVKLPLLLLQPHGFLLFIIMLVIKFINGAAMLIIIVVIIVIFVIIFDSSLTKAMVIRTVAIAVTILIPVLSATVRCTCVLLLVPLPPSPCLAVLPLPLLPLLSRVVGHG